MEEGVSVPSSCSLRVSIVEWLSGVVAPLPWGVNWLLTGSRPELHTQREKNLRPLRNSGAHTKALHLSARGVTTDTLVRIQAVSHPAVIGSPTGWVWLV